MMMLNESKVKQLVDILYPYFLQRMNNDGLFKNYVKTKNATVTSETAGIGETVSVCLPYDSKSFAVTNDTGVVLKQGDLVTLIYWIDLKNAVAKYLCK